MRAEVEATSRGSSDWAAARDLAHARARVAALGEKAAGGRRISSLVTTAIATTILEQLEQAWNAADGGLWGAVRR